MDIAFPKSLLFGAVASAHEAEGGAVDSDWQRWEQRPGRIRGDATSATGAGHYERFAQDFALARQFGHTAHLFTVEWARVAPRPDAFDEDALRHYAEVASTLRGLGITPYCALHHVTLPRWIADGSGWTSAETVERFAAYTRRVVAAIGSDCAAWIPLLDPMHTVMRGYGLGDWPPERTGLGIARGRAVTHVIAAHFAAWRAIKETDSAHQVGVSIRATRSEPVDPDSAWDLRAAWRWDGFAAWLLPDAVLGVRRRPGLSHAEDAPAADFIGLTWGGRHRVRFGAFRPASLCAVATPLADPREAGTGLDAAITDAATYGAPIVVTGIDLTAPDDATRCVLLLDRLREIRSAMRAGADVRALFARSLLDGFAWRDGYEVRSGLFHVARDTLARTPNDSAYLFKEVCETGRLRRGTLGRHCPHWEPLPNCEEPWPFG